MIKKMNASTYEFSVFRQFSDYFMTWRRIFTFLLKNTVDFMNDRVENERMLKKMNVPTHKFSVFRQFSDYFMFLSTFIYLLTY